jgi:biotin operon repressor
MATYRQVTYAALRDAGEQGITREELRRIVGAPVAPHIESLRHEGLGIEDVPFREARGQVWGYRLEYDPWAALATAQ